MVAPTSTLATPGLAGAAGMLGSRIAHHLLQQPEARVRLIVRDLTSKKSALDPLAAKGAELIEGDLADAASLDRATQGVDVIVSAVQGGPDVIVDGQVALATAGKRNGVRRILPSDFGLDLFKATPGEHAAFDWRRTADERIAAAGLEQVNKRVMLAYLLYMLNGHAALSDLQNDRYRDLPLATFADFVAQKLPTRAAA